MQSRRRAEDRRAGNHHESHYLHLPTAAVKRAKATHNLGFAAAMPSFSVGYMYYLHKAYHQAATPSLLRTACTLGRCRELSLIHI